MKCRWKISFHHLWAPKIVNENQLCAGFVNLLKAKSENANDDEKDDLTQVLLDEEKARKSLTQPILEWVWSWKTRSLTVQTRACYTQEMTWMVKKITKACKTNGLWITYGTSRNFSWIEESHDAVARLWNQKPNFVDNSDNLGINFRFKLTNETYLEIKTGMVEPDGTIETHDRAITGLG